MPSRSELIRLADESLYEAKGSGRNRVVHAEELSLAFVEEAHLGAHRTTDGDDGARRPDDRDGPQGTTFASDRERAPDGDGDAPEPAVAALDAGGPSAP